MVSASLLIDAMIGQSNFKGFHLTLYLSQSPYLELIGLARLCCVCVLSRWMIAHHFPQLLEGVPISELFNS